MPAITEDTVRALAGFHAASAPVTTCYLDVDGRYLPTHQDVQRAFDALVRRLGLSGETPTSVRRDLYRMERHVRGFARGGVRGLAMFSCSAHDLWEVHDLPVRVTSQLVVHRIPSVRQLEDVLEEYVRFGVLLVDQQRARMFVYELGELVEHSEVLDEVVRLDADDRGEKGYKHRQGSQVLEETRQHVRRAAQLAFAVFQRHQFDRLIVGAPSELTGELEQALHPYLRDRLADRIQVAVNAPEDQIRRAAHEVEQGVERRNEAALIGQLREAVGARARAVAGLKDTLPALCDRRVDRLFVSRGASAEGWRCLSCGCLAMLGRRCPACGGEMVHVDDVVEEAVQEALVQHCRVEVCVGNADLDVLGGIGALLRF